MRLAPRSSALAIFVISATLAACVGDERDETEGEETASDEYALTDAEARGQVLFEDETFDGNDRTCTTCHRGASGTLSPAEVEALFQSNPSDPLFRSIDSDDGEGSSYTRLREEATIRITLALPPNIRPLDDLDATHVVVNRAIPTTNNASLDAVLMYDGRGGTLESQALGAVHDHYENGREPTGGELADIAAFETTLFSNPQLADFAAGGNEPKLPRGTTAAEKAGARAFKKHCTSCHSGPNLSEDVNLPIDSTFRHFQGVFAGVLGVQTEPLREWAVVDPDTHEVLSVAPLRFNDPGLALTTGNPDDFLGFKILSLWNVKNTAPYFHDNSAKTLEEVINHYVLFFEFSGRKPMSADAKATLPHFLRLL